MLVLSIIAGGQARQCELHITRRGYTPFSKVTICRANFAGQEISCYSNAYPGALDDGKTITIRYDERFNPNYFWNLYTDNNGPRCGGHNPGFRVTNAVTTAFDDICVTTFWFTKSFWRCKTRSTFRFQVRLKCDNTWYKIQATNGFPSECFDLYAPPRRSSSSGGGGRGRGGGGGGRRNTRARKSVKK